MTVNKSKRSKQGGFLVSMELAIIGSLIVAGLLIGMVSIRDAMVAEMKDVADAINSINNSYSFAGLTLTNGGILVASVAGSSFSDSADNSSGQGAAGVISYSQGATAE